MKLILDAFRLLATKFVAILVIASVLLAAAFAWNWAREQRSFRSEASRLRSEGQRLLQDWRGLRLRALDLERQLHELEAAKPSPLLHPSDYLEWRARMEVAAAAATAARAARDRAKAIHETGERQLAAVEGHLHGFYADLEAVARRSGRLVALAVLAFLLGPISWKAFWYYGIARLAGKAPPLRLASPDVPGSIRAIAAGKVIEVPVQPGAPLLTRMEWLQQYDPGLAKRTRFLFDWRAPFTSYAAGLREMTEVASRDGDSGGMAVLTSASNPNAYLIALELDGHPGIVLHPGSVVAVRGAISMKARWRFTSVHAWIAGRLRHLLFSGTGTVYVTGHGGIDLCHSSRPMVVEEALVLGYDCRAEFGAVRTETFWPYFRQHTSLFDYRFAGGQTFLRQTAAPTEHRARANPFERTLQSILNGIRNLLGF